MLSIGPTSSKNISAGKRFAKFDVHSYAPAMPPETDADILALFDRDMRANPPPPGPGYRQERLAGASFSVGPKAEAHHNTLEYSALDERSADGCIDAVVARFAELKHGLEWKVHAHDRPTDLGARLLAKGFEQGGRETLMVRPVGTDDAPASPAGIEIRRVTEPAALADLVAVETEVWNDDNSWLAGALAAELAQDAQALAIYIAYAGATPVSTGWIRFHGGRAFATLWGGSTLKAYRSRGIYRALVGIRAALARARGAAYLAVEASDDSRPILERNGFRALTVIDSYFKQTVET
jgi:GNAT superfamily N-acetyltransferase